MITRTAADKLGCGLPQKEPTLLGTGANCLYRIILQG